MSAVELIDENKSEISIGRLCTLFGISRSGYYAARFRRPSSRQVANARLMVDIRAIHRQYRALYGSPRVTAELRALGHQAGRHRVARLMRKEGIVARPRRRFAVTTSADPRALPAPNVLERSFEAHQPNSVWVGDFTYIPTLEGWLFLAVLVDLYSRRIVGWATSDSLKTDVALRALRRGLESRNPPPGLIPHTDRGCQYMSRRYRDSLAKHGATASMSRPANCIDNAAAESLVGTLKHELDRRVFASRAAAHQDFARYIDGFYNPERRHSALGQLAPIEFERLVMVAKAA